MATHSSLTRTALTALAVSVAMLLVNGCSSDNSSSEQVELSGLDLSSVEVSATQSSLSSDWQQGVMMEIYLRGYKDSDGDGHGDLRGLIDKLDYLKTLGIRGIWLMPIMASQDHDHGYAVSDYRAIEADYGSLADFDELIRQAHQRGIGIIIDYVMNHSAVENPLFQASRSSPGSPYRDWYIWQPSSPSGWSIYNQNPWYSGYYGSYFAGFWSQMPDFNLRNPDVIAFHHDNLRFWLNRGVDGVRFDATGNLIENGPDAWEMQPENKLLLGEVRQLLNQYENRFMVCESPAIPLAYAGSDACGSAFAFGHQYDVIAAATGDQAAIQATADYFLSAPLNTSTLLSNHDSFAGDRLWEQFQGDTVQYRLAVATHLLLPGTPFLYYGEEIGMGGAEGLSGDHRLRSPMSWSGDSRNGGFSSATPFRALASNVSSENVAAELNDPNSLLNFYKAVIALRNSQPALQKGAYSSPSVNQRQFSFQRLLGQEQILVALNYGKTAVSSSLQNLPANSRWQPLWPTNGSDLLADLSGSAPLRLTPQTFAVWKLSVN